MPQRKTRKPDDIAPAPVPATMAKRSARLPSGLTVKQETFAHCVAQGTSYIDAYRTAYDPSPDASPHTSYVEAYKLSRHPEIAKRILFLQDKMLEEHSALARTRGVRVVATLESLMEGAKRDADKIKCAELLGKSVGLFDRNDGDPAQAEATLADLEGRLGELMAKIK